MKILIDRKCSPDTFTEVVAEAVAVAVMCSVLMSAGLGLSFGFDFGWMTFFSMVRFKEAIRRFRPTCFDGDSNCWSENRVICFGARFMLRGATSTKPSDGSKRNSSLDTLLPLLLAFSTILWMNFFGVVNDSLLDWGFNAMVTVVDFVVDVDVCVCWYDVVVAVCDAFGIFGFIT